MLHLHLIIAIIIQIPVITAIIYYLYSRKKKKIIVTPIKPPIVTPIKVKTLDPTKIEVYIPVEEYDPEGYGVDVLATVGIVKRTLEEDDIPITLEVKKVEYGSAWICKKCRAMFLTSYLTCPRCNGELKEYEASKQIFFPKIRGQKEKGKEEVLVRILPTVFIDGQIYVEGATISRRELEEQLRKLEERKQNLRKRREEEFWMKFGNADYYVLPKQWFFDHPVRSPYGFRIVPRDQIRFTGDGRIKIMMRSAPDIPFSEEAVEIMEQNGLRVLRWEEMTDYFSKIPIIEEEAPELSTELARQKSKEYLQRLEE